MKKAKINRLLCQTGAMIGSYAGNRSWLFEKMASLYQKRNMGAHQDRSGQEQIVKNSGLSWLIIKPPRLQDRQTSVLPKVGPDVRVGLLSSVSRLQIARFMLEEALEPGLENEVVFIKG